MKHDHCVACGSQYNLCQHHLTPRSLGGSDDDENLLTLCGTCHAKAHQVQASWRHSDLTRTALQAKKERGERMGKIPFGFQLDANGVTIAPCQYEQETLSQIDELRHDGYSLQRIANQLNSQKRFNRQGNPWNAPLLHAICKNLNQRLAV